MGTNFGSPIRGIMDDVLVRREGECAVYKRMQRTLSEGVMSQLRPAKRRTTVSVGESVRIIRELQELSQNQLAELTGIPQATISAIENDRVSLGVERAKVLARALKCHPAVLVFPGWDADQQSAA